MAAEELARRDEVHRLDTVLTGRPSSKHMSIGALLAVSTGRVGSPPCIRRVVTPRAPLFFLFVFCCGLLALLPERDRYPARGPRHPTPTY